MIIPYTYESTRLNQYLQAQSKPVANNSQHEISAYDGVAYHYIGDTRLATVTSSAGSYELAYDALGRCVRRTSGGQASVYYGYDGERALHEFDAAGNKLASSVYGIGIDEIIARFNNGATQFLQQDRLGNISAVTDPDGVVLEQYRYDAFGQPEFHGPPIAGNPGGALLTGGTLVNNRFLFTGREWVARYGFYEYRNRAYNPTLGRFMSEDPKGFAAGDRNLFRYCAGDPVNRTDPMGLEDLVLFPPGEHHRVYDAGPQVYDIGAHGRNGVIYNERGQPMTVRDLMNRMKRDPAFQRASEVRCWACEAGKGNNPIAKQIARSTGKPTAGPTELFWEIGKKGVVAPADAKNPDRPAKHERGTWIQFSRRETSQQNPRDDGRRDSQNSTHRQQQGEQQSTSQQQTSTMTAAQIDAQHQATGVPSLGAEAVNLARGTP